MVHHGAPPAMFHDTLCELPQAQVVDGVYMPLYRVSLTTSMFPIVLWAVKGSINGVWVCRHAMISYSDKAIYDFYMSSTVTSSGVVNLLWDVNIAFPPM